MFSRLKSRVRKIITAQIHGPLLRELKCGPTSQVSQLALAEFYKKDKLSRSFREVGFSVYSEFDEDGILLYLFAVLEPSSRTLIEIGCGDGLENNTSNLIINHNWNGVLIDAYPDNCVKAISFYKSARSTKLCPPSIICERIDQENVNEVLVTSGLTGKNIDLLSIDIDSIDLWVIEALKVVKPRVIVVEINSRWAENFSMTTPKDGGGAPIFDPELGMIFGGASLAAFCLMLGRKGYRLIGSNHVATNVFFLRNDLGENIFAEISAGDVLKSERAVRIREKCADKLDIFPWVEYV